MGFRLGGTKVWGTAPYYDSAFLGSRSIRGLRTNRFAGDAALYGNVGLLFRVGKASIVVPGRWGFLLRADGGRVWLEGDDSDTWHWAYGGGIWWAPWDFNNAVRLYVANSDQGTAVYLLLGFGF